MRRQSHPNFGFADNFEKTNKPNCCKLVIWLISDPPGVVCSGGISLGFNEMTF